MGDPPYAPLEGRVKAVMKVVNRHADRMGRKVMVAFNISDDNDAMRRHHDLVVKEVGAVNQILQGFAPAVMSGAMPWEVVKEMIMVVARRSKMGSAVEDALEKMQAPNPPQDPNAGKVQADMQMQQQQMQHEAQLEQMKAQLADQQHQRELQANMQAEQQKAQLQAQVQQHAQEVQAKQTEQQNQLEAQRAQLEAELSAQLEREKQAGTLEIERMKLAEARYKVDADNATQIEVAELAAHVQAASIQSQADTAAATAKTGEGDDGGKKLATATNEALIQLVEHLGRPRKVTRGADGLIAEIG